MGRKKKPAQKRKDARGYSQGNQTQQRQPQPASTKGTTSLTAKTHNEIRDLLGNLDVNDTNAAHGGNTMVDTATGPSNRFESRLSNVVDRLKDLGFTDSHIERVVVALRYEITLELALDWLCLHLETLELPTLFTDGTLRDNLATVTTEGSLTVLKMNVVPNSSTDDTSNTTINNGNREENVLAISATKEGTDEKTELDVQKEKERAKELKEQEERKRWLLQQYEYEAAEEDADEAESQIEAPNSSQEPLETIAAPSLTPEEELLLEEEKKLKEMEADVNNDANNYMRSKQEIKQLKNELKKFKQQVAGLRKKVEREKAKREKAEKEAAAVESKENEEDSDKKDDEDEANGAGMFDLFGTSADDEEDEEEDKPASNPHLSTKRQSYLIPKGWTGVTPQRKLDEVCRKLKLPRPKYNKLPRNEGFRLSVTVAKRQQPQHWEARIFDYETGSSLKDYLATQALYAIDPSVPLYQVLPPAFRELWLSWVNAKKKEEDKVKEEQENEKSGRLNQLLSMIADVQGGQHTANIAQDPRADVREKGIETLDAPNNWDEEDEDELPSSFVNPAPTNHGARLKRDFVELQSSKAYQRMKQIRTELPMHCYREKILDMVKSRPVTILCAETGAGKTTQCPQYLLEEALLQGKGDKVNILCTQPRRVAATSVAERVADEICIPLGKTVGYQIRMENKRSAETKLLFCTTGVVLRRLQDDSNLQGITHVIVDEVHERQQQTDLLLIILRQLLRTTRPDLKVILMSATLDSKLFCSFFENAPLISVPGRTFPVANYFLEDLMDATDHVIEEGSRYAKREDRYEEKTSLWVTNRGGDKRREVVDLVSQVAVDEVTIYPGYKMSTRRSMQRVDEQVINYDLIEDVLLLLLVNRDQCTLEAPEGSDLSRGSILVFLPGLGEIKAMTERLEGNRHLGKKQRFEIIPMHSTLSSRDQRRAFVPSKQGSRKIILATNIAETSVTIPDVVCAWCSKASSKQRAGRAGRVQPGLCLKLYSSGTAYNIMKDATEPELRRVPLEEVCLSILASGFSKNCLQFLNQAPQPPDPESVETAIAVLDEIGAVDRQASTEVLTPLGQHLAKLPLDVRLGKMLIFGALFRCIDPVVTIAASLSSKSPFSAFVADAAVAKAKHNAFADSESDFVTYCNVWEAYALASEKSMSEARKFCTRNYLNFVAMREIGEARQQFLDQLSRIGFIDRATLSGSRNRFDSKATKSSALNGNADKETVVQAVICAGLFPNVARLEQPTSGDCELWQNEQRLFFHRSSVNSKRKHFGSSNQWVVFHEKLGTANRTSVSTTCLVHPFALLLFGGTVEVKHLHRTVVVDDWMTIGVAAQTGVILRELRKKVDSLLQRMIESPEVHGMTKTKVDMIEGIVSILSANGSS
ncbi:unnamed protein product [Cylindrotheca closterium]|uniref:RNA helicase n=1 Tax=Cylindrotheca closterium TaxID=2856 RepID=A0AAD2CGP0_9STRA|nr:unnamed protein product [Cylindrotheca closterium]